MYLQHGLQLRPDRRRADIDARLHAVADLQLPGALHHGRDELVVDRVLHDGAAGGGAFLSGGEERGIHHVLDRGVEVGVGQHDGRVLAAHLELDAQPALRRLLVQPVADLAGAGERDGLSGLAFTSASPKLAAGAGDEVDHALGNAGLVQRLDDAPRAQRRGGRRLEHHGVAADQRRAPASMPGSRSGKFHGVISPTTPTGLRIANMCTRSRSEGTSMPGMREPSPAK